MADGQKLDLNAAAARAGLKTPRPVPLFEPTAAQDAEIERLIKKIVAAWNVALREEILPAYRDGIKRRAGSPLALGITSGELFEIEQALNRATEATVRAAAALEPQIAQFVVGFTAWHTARFVSGVQSASGVNLLPVLTTEDASDIMQAAIRRNVSLIKGLNEDMRRKVETAVLTAWNENSSAKRLTKILRSELGFAPSRARLIGRDQISKLAGELDKMRSESLGLKAYVWVTRQDDRVRPRHQVQHGKTYLWSKPTPAGFPGSEINCRCRARPIIEPKT